MFRNIARVSSLVSFASLSIALASGCAVQSAAPTDSAAESDLSAGKLTVADNKALMDLLQAADAPSNTPAGVLGVGSRIGRIDITTAQGGIAKFISEGGEVSTVAGAKLGDIFTFGGNWQAISKALTDGGAAFETTSGEHGASSSIMSADVTCTEVVSPSAKPKCTVTPIGPRVASAADSEILMNVLEAADAPSNLPAGNVGVGSRIARIELTTAQGGQAHFISQGGSVVTLDGKHLADVVSLGVAWKDLSNALADTGAGWLTQNGPHGSSSSTMSAKVECSQVVSPSAKPSCTVTADPQH